MKKDIEIPKVENVHIVAIREWNDDFQEDCWYAYLLNATNEPLEMAMIVSRAYGLINGENRNTSSLRHAFAKVEPQSAVKIEFLENNVLQLNNEFLVSYFLNNKMFDKKFIFKVNGINEKAQSDLPAINKRGVMAI
ncbi:phenylalanyl-tRNA synthetase subunit alpha [Flavobacterium sp. 316]|uniref:Phenylalanyl-tRNA synthetase subunit alpha n=1 Tax=Flavobacterium sediminilitoris TaxID=2024526 RepID=A0ABY4HQ35_9FLAO|nr:MULTISPECIES: hypothetical protein [Flavobacterium]KIX20614.1 phenylalanyl-tRNA synthetase subunit alpha [Flavobacterium sp. 316]UOX34795.1 hypothetical protein LXD69_04625 [Flavobacterium sediminilitoris]